MPLQVWKLQMRGGGPGGEEGELWWGRGWQRWAGAMAVKGEAWKGMQVCPQFKCRYLEKVKENPGVHFEMYKYVFRIFLE